MGEADLKRIISLEKNSPFKRGRHHVALLYDAPYRAGMASLGYLSVHRLFNEHPDFSCERAFSDLTGTDASPLTLETGRPLNRFPVIAVSMAWELEVIEFIGILKKAQIPVLQSERCHDDPLIIAGGPLTQVVPSLLAPLADIIFIGETEASLPPFLDLLATMPPRDELLQRAAAMDGIYVPTIHSGAIPASPAVPLSLLPAWSTFETPLGEFGAKSLIEVERGCARACAFCVMSRKASACTFRVVPPETIFSLLDPTPASVGLVGAAVTDHPQIHAILEHFVNAGSEVSLSSLRADRVDEAMLDLLKRGGMKTLTVAADGPSERIRQSISKGISGDQLIDLAQRARLAGIGKMKLYQMAGFPREDDSDIREMGQLLMDLSEKISLTVTVSPLVPKPSTPLASAPFPPERQIKSVLKNLKRAVKGRVIIRPVSWRDAALEYALDQLGGEAVDELIDHVDNQSSRGALVASLMGMLRHN
ncbi:B12-binding domain-containing radical SAM protein [Myxococcota bacterium]|nr:B12-binding domain-containing radical SAM protein [Myxococcota bacterium]